MKIFAIQEFNNKVVNVGYLFYYEKAKEFYIELPENLEEWDVPLLLASLYKKGIRTINSYWSKVWVKQRIIPSDRQNIGQILKDNKLKTYDEFGLLMLAKGKCEQDNYYLTDITEKELPKKILNRFKTRVSDILLLDNKSLFVFFRNGQIKLCDLKEHFSKHKQFEVIDKKEYFKHVKILVGGYGIAWDTNLIITDNELYALGKEVTVSSDILERYVKNNVLTTTEVMEELNCSRQYVNELVKINKLHPLKSSKKNTLFLKYEVMKINWY